MGNKKIVAQQLVNKNNMNKKKAPKPCPPEKIVVRDIYYDTSQSGYPEYIIEFSKMIENEHYPAIKKALKKIVNSKINEQKTPRRRKRKVSSSW